MSFYIAIGIAWIIREIYFHILTHRLINKLMSRDFAEYRWAQTSGKIKMQPKVKVDDGEPEDVEILEGIGRL